MAQSKTGWDTRSWIILGSGIGVCLPLMWLLMFGRTFLASLRGVPSGLFDPDTVGPVVACAAIYLTIALPIALALTARRRRALWAVAPSLACLIYRLTLMLDPAAYPAARNFTQQQILIWLLLIAAPTGIGCGIRWLIERGKAKRGEGFVFDATSQPGVWPPPPPAR